LFHARSIEQRVLDHLRLRDRRATTALDGPQVTELALAGAIFGGDKLHAGGGMVIRGARMPTAAAEAIRLDRQRRAHLAGARQDRGMSWAAARRCGHGRFVLLHRRSYFDACGSAIVDRFGVHVITTASGHRRHQRDAIAAARHLLKRSIASEGAGDVAMLVACRERVTRRIDAIRRLLRSGRIEQQASMFDRRSDDLVSARRVALRRLDDGLSRVANAIALPSETRVRSDLVAAWPEARR